jgi:DNA-binding CsgD family transcriptional regulator
VLSAVRLAQLNPKQDHMSGWRSRAIRNRRPLTPEQLIVLQEIKRLRATDKGDAGMSTYATLAQAGNFRVHRLRDGFVDYRLFCQTAHYQLFYKSLGITDRIWIVFPLNAAAESYFLFDRVRNQRRFTQRDAEIAAYALRGLRWFHLRLFLGQGLLVSENILNEVQQRVVQELLTGNTEKEIAVNLSLSVPTTHKHIKSIYRAFGIQSRAALMALWLGGR